MACTAKNNHTHSSQTMENRTMREYAGIGSQNFKKLDLDEDATTDYVIILCVWRMFHKRKLG